MDQEKMAEGRRLATEQRRLATEQQRAEAEQQRIEEEKARLEKERQEEERRERKERLKEQRREDFRRRSLEPLTIRQFDQLKIQLKTFYDELSILSKKTPNGPVNKFKLKFLNDTLKGANAILGTTHRPFPDFELFTDDELPSTSDAVLMLSHYLKSMDRYYFDHSQHIGQGYRKWCEIGAEVIEDEDNDEDDEN